MPSVVRRAERIFADAGLTLPPIPGRFANELRTVEEWCFATREINPMAMYLFDDYIREALLGTAPDYLAFCHAGHGINSYAITYHLVDGPLALFVQAPWGGGYSNTEKEAGALAAQFTRCAALIEAVDRAKARGLSGPPGRLVVVESMLRGDFRWGWVDGPLDDEAAADAWLHPSGQSIVDDRTYPQLEAELPTVAARQWLDTRDASPSNISIV
jgi:hypothetical protein